MRWLLLLSCFICASIRADQSITASSALLGETRTVNRGASQIIFVLGSNITTLFIGNAQLSLGIGNPQSVIPISAVGDNQKLGQINYTLSAGKALVMEIR